MSAVLFGTAMQVIAQMKIRRGLELEMDVIPPVFLKVVLWEIQGFVYCG